MPEKNRKLKIIGFTFAFLLVCPAIYCQANSQALEKVSLPQIYDYQISEFAEESFSWDLPQGRISEAQINKEAILAGWGAFSQNFGLQGAVFTYMEECLSASFLSNINNLCGKIGGYFVLLQLAIDLANKDYKSANINFAKGSIGYAIGKWGSSAFKVGAAAAVAVDWYLTTIATTVYKAHDDFYYRVLTYYFVRGPGRRHLRDWKKVFMAADVNSKEDVLKIVDDYVEEFWSSEQEMAAAVGALKGFAGKWYRSYPTVTFVKAKEHFKGKMDLYLETSDAIASFYGTQEILENKIYTSKEIFAKINKVTVSDIRKVSQEIFRPEKLNLALIGPFKEKKEFQEILKL